MSAEAPPSPFDLFGPLLAAIQTREIFADGKTFVDARPVRPVGTIMDDFAKLGDCDDPTLARFVDSNFELPEKSPPWTGGRSDTLLSHIREGWVHLARPPASATGECSRLAVKHPHVVPGGRFRELYYWDSFFTMLGLIRDGEFALATGIVDAMTDLIERYGHIPNGTRTYYLGRSQPPLYHMMVSLLEGCQPEASSRRIAAMKAEHAWWMRGENDVAPGQCEQHVVRLNDGSILNRYWDPRSTPRDESWREDIETAARSNRPREDVFRDLRAGAESGWDFSSRWLDNENLETIHTTAIIPVDLNAFLYSLERTIAASDDVDAPAYARRADRRLVAIHTHCWDRDEGFFVDFDLRTRAGRRPTGAGLTPLLCHVATPEQADAMAQFTAAYLLAPGGLRTSLICSGQQWDAPNGWAPLQWMAVQGLENYGLSDLAAQIARRWIRTVSDTFHLTGHAHEKYDIENCSIGGGGEYEPQIGFGWTNGVTRDLIARYAEIGFDPLNRPPSHDQFEEMNGLRSMASCRVHLSRCAP